jgi:hypothetical protein
MCDRTKLWGCGPATVWRPSAKCYDRIRHCWGVSARRLGVESRFPGQGGHQGTEVENQQGAFRRLSNPARGVEVSLSFLFRCVRA